VAFLAAAETSTLRAYVVLSLLVGARTEELRALRWDHVDLDGKPSSTPQVPPIDPGLALRGALRQHRDQQQAATARAVDVWTAQRLVFGTRNGTELEASNVGRSFRRVLVAAGLDPTAWRPRELRHSFVSLLPAHGGTVEQIADLVGHAGTTVTEAVYRHELRPMLLDGATMMDQIFPSSGVGQDLA
jgi:integrase